jgi:hypothetical protein
MKEERGESYKAGERRESANWMIQFDNLEARFQSIENELEFVTPHTHPPPPTPPTHTPAGHMKIPKREYHLITITVMTLFHFFMGKDKDIFETILLITILIGTNSHRSPHKEVTLFNMQNHLPFFTTQLESPSSTISSTCTL